ncbi:MAG: hypothetical protein PHD37_12420 [Gallionellaceae bacterium]|nr:hypothetical protein [Gallionellaceae bacterium]
MFFRALPLVLVLIAAPVKAGEHAHQAVPREQRAAIYLTTEEKAHIHQEMRLFLSSTQKIVASAAANDMKGVAEAARAAGMAAAHDVPAKLREKLPMQFKKLGHLTHQGFDDLARDADSLGDASQALKQLGQVMGNCVSCHAVFRIETGKR